MTFAANYFNATEYLTNNTDVVSAIARGNFTSALDHFTKFGRYENRSPNASWNASQYMIDNPDVTSAIGSGGIASAWDHFTTFGINENRASGVFTGTFNASAYLAANADVQAAVTAGSFSSAYEHFILFGAGEGRAATTTTGTTIALRTGSTVGAVSDSNGATGGSVAENAAIGTAVGITASATDATVGDTVAYSLTTNPSNLFAIDATTGVVTVNGALDHEVAASRSITVTATSSDGSLSANSFSIAITNLNEHPVSAVSDVNAAANTVAENAAVGAVVGLTASATDADASTTLSYSLTNGDGSAYTGPLRIDGSTGVVTVGSALDFETATSQGVVVRATSSDGSVNSQAFTVAVTNVNDNALSAVTDSNAAANTLAENAQVGAAVGITALATDADAGATVSYSLTDDAGGRFAINSSTGVVTLASALNFEAAASHAITVSAASNDGSPATTATFNIAVTDVNEAPTALALTDQLASIAENTAVTTPLKVADIVVTDDALGTETFSLSGANADSFEVVGTGLFLRAGTSLNFEGQSAYNVTVSGSDASLTGSTPVSANYALAVTNVNEAPVAVADGPFSVVTGNSITMTVLANDTDVDAGTTLSMSGAPTVANSAGTATINANNQLVFTAASGFQGVATISYNITDGTNVVAATQQVSVGEPALSAASSSVNEGQAVAFNLKGVANTTYSVSVDSIGLNDVVDSIQDVTTNASGEATLTFATTADRTTEGAQSLRANIIGTLAAPVVVTVNDTSLNNVAPVTSNVAQTVAEGAAAITGQLTATDADAQDTNPTFTTASVVPGFSLNANGSYSFDPSNAAYDTLAVGQTSVQTVNFVVNDNATNAGGGAQTAAGTLTITVTGTNDAPVVTVANSAPTVNENTTAVTTFTTSDVDAGATLSGVTLSGEDASLFQVVGGNLAFRTAPDFEVATDANRDGIYNVTLNVSDNVGATGSTAVQVTVANVGEVMVLTAGADFGAAFTGTSEADTFAAAEVAAGGLITPTFTVGDTLDGGTGTDTLTISQTAPFTVPVGTSVTSIENVNITSGGTVTINTVSTGGGFSGLTALGVNHDGNATVTAAATTAVTVTGTLAAATVNVNGGSNVTVTETGGTGGGTINVGTTTAAAGTVTVSSATSEDAVTAASINVTGGTTIAITQSQGNAVNTTNTNGLVTVVGNASTTGVTVTNAAAATASATVAGVTAAVVAITDVNDASTTAAGTITSATVSNYTTLSFAGSALTTLSLTGGSGNIIIGNGNLATPTNLTLGVTANGLTGGTLDDSDIYTTLNVTTTGANSTLANVTFGAATALTVAGDKALTLSSIAGLSALTSVTSTSSAALTIGSNIGTGVSFTGGSGVDTISLAATGTETISTGDGNDSVTYGGALGTGGTVNAGDGTADTLIMTAAQAVTATASTAFAATVSNFEVLRLSAATGAAAAINMANADGINSLSIAGATVGALTVTNAAADFTLTQRALTSFASSVALKDATGTADNVNLVYTAADGFTNSAAFTIADVDRLTITTTDTNTTAQTALIVTPITATSAATVTISGDMGVSLIGGMTQTTLTSLNAAGLTASGAFGGLTFTSGALVASSVITGSAAGTNTINLNAATTASTFVTYTGGTGNDVIDSTNNLNNVFTLGNGTNSINTGGAAGNGNNTVTAGTGGDTIRLGNGNNTIDVGAGTNLVEVGNGNNTITGGTGADTITVGTGSNTIVVGGGTSVNSVTVGAAAGLNTITTTSTGVDTFVLGGIQVAGGFYSSLNGWAAGDVIDFALVTGNASAVSPLGAKITLGAAASFANYLDAAAIDTNASTGAAVIKWFDYGSNTYIVVDNSDLGSFTDGLDSVVELVGTYNLSTSTVAADVLTFV